MTRSAMFIRFHGRAMHAPTGLAQICHSEPIGEESPAE